MFMTIHALGFELVRALEDQYSAEELVQGKYSHAITALLLWQTLKEDCPNFMVRYSLTAVKINNFARRLVKSSLEPNCYWSGPQDYRSNVLYHVTHEAFNRMYSGWLSANGAEMVLLHRYCVMRIYVHIASL